MAQKQKRVRWSPMLLVIASALATVIALVVWSTDPFGYEPREDSRQYHNMAASLLEVGTFSTQSEPPFVASARRVPGYPMALALVYFFAGPQVLTAKLVQCLLLTPAICWQAYMLALRVSNRKRLALLAAAGASLMPTTTAMTNHLMPEALLTLVLLALANCAYRWRDSTAILWPSCVGLLGGLAALIKPEALFVAVFVAFAVTLSAGCWRIRVPQSVWVVLLVGIVVAPWVYRNYAVLGVATIQGGTDAEGAGMGFMRRYRLQAEHGFLFEPDRHKYFFEDVKQAQADFDKALTEQVQDENVSDKSYWLARPLLFGQYSLVRLYDLLRPASWSDVYSLNGDFGFYKSEGKWFHLGAKLAMLAFDLGVVVAGLLGLIWSLRIRHRQIWIVSSIVAYFVLVYALLHGLNRYRCPVMPELLLLGLWLAIPFWEFLFGRRQKARSRSRHPTFSSSVQAD